MDGVSLGRVPGRISPTDAASGPMQPSASPSRDGSLVLPEPNEAAPAPPPLGECDARETAPKPSDNEVTTLTVALLHLLSDPAAFGATAQCDHVNDHVNIPTTPPSAGHGDDATSDARHSEPDDPRLNDRSAPLGQRAPTLNAPANSASSAPANSTLNAPANLTSNSDPAIPTRSVTHSDAAPSTIATSASPPATPISLVDVHPASTTSPVTPGFTPEASEVVRSDKSLVQGMISLEAGDSTAPTGRPAETAAVAQPFESSAAAGLPASPSVRGAAPEPPTDATPRGIISDEPTEDLLQNDTPLRTPANTVLPSENVGIRLPGAATPNESVRSNTGHDDLGSSISLPSDNSAPSNNSTDKNVGKNDSTLSNNAVSVTLPADAAPSETAVGAAAPGTLASDTAPSIALPNGAAPAERAPSIALPSNATPSAAITSAKIPVCDAEAISDSYLAINAQQCVVCAEATEISIPDVVALVQANALAGQPTIIAPLDTSDDVTPLGTLHDFARPVDALAPSLQRLGELSAALHDKTTVIFLTSDPRLMIGETASPATWLAHQQAQIDAVRGHGNEALIVINGFTGAQPSRDATALAAQLQMNAHTVGQRSNLLVDPYIYMYFLQASRKRPRDPRGRPNQRQRYEQYQRYAEHRQNARATAEADMEDQAES